MSSIELDKRFDESNFISLRGKFNDVELQNTIMKMTNEFKEYLSEKEYLITTTFSAEVISGSHVLDVEILIPVKEKVEVNEPYIFKPRIKIENALYSKLEEDLSQLNHLLDSINNYVIDNKLQPITTAYIVQSKVENSIDIEVYLGLSENIL